MNWLKLEIYFDFKYLMFDVIEMLKVVEILVKKGFVVLFYVYVDFVLCKWFEEVGMVVVMLFGLVIGLNKGFSLCDFFWMIID